MKSILLIIIAVTMAVAQANENTVQAGAEIYSERCVICHGPAGMGEGFLPLTLDNYPNTSLFRQGYAEDVETIKRIILDGGVGDKSIFSPPWRNELNEAEIDSVAAFIVELHQSPESARALVANRTVAMETSSVETGRRIYKSRCALCHGETGLGDGKMSKVVKTPPPFNLTLSVMPDAYLAEIIRKGGEAMGRSYQMPPWVDELSESEIVSVIDFIKTLRVLDTRLSEGTR